MVIGMFLDCFMHVKLRCLYDFSMAFLKYTFDLVKIFLKTMDLLILMEH